MIPAATGAELHDLLRSCLAVPRWIREVEVDAPYFSAGSMLDRARRAATPLSRTEIDQALAEHPRIGQRPAGPGRAAGFSRREQQAPDADDADLAAAIAQGNAAYEERFGRVFLIRAAGRTRAEIRAEQVRRLGLDEETELAIVGAELREIALLRLRTLLDEDAAATASFAAAGAAVTTAVTTAAAADRSHITTHVLDAVSGTPAADLAVTLEQHTPDTKPSWTEIGGGRTGSDGRINTLGPVALPAGRYRVTFDTGGYFASRGVPAFYPEVVISIELADPEAHYHVPLLLSPFAYSTYRGS
ncbi:MAG TPA: 2-oxo-4-hydroxy-4-carboxy-5-ureidoimidazoline decarboxylase [Actinocrinis sp.]|nr:2-oxo-4-hydroxy-4-carboxy-5-ureidoimidazoline decarboxylase [Actinocrinis sp.]